MDIKEKVLNNRKNGMAMMLLFIIFYAAAAGIMLVGAITELIPLMLLAIIWISIGWIPFLGLKVLKPQEALVLTLFGKYVGTLKDAGFYWVNPFCSSVNPAAKTKLNQSGDVDGCGSRCKCFCKCIGSKQKDFPEDYDTQQQPSEDQ